MPAPSFTLFATIFPKWISHVFGVNLPDALSNVSSKAYFHPQCQGTRWGFLTPVQSKHLLAHLSLYCYCVSLHIGSHLPLCIQRITVRLHLKGSFNEVLVLQGPSSPCPHQSVSKSKWSGLKLANRWKLMSFFSSKSGIHTWIEEWTEDKINARTCESLFGVHGPQIMIIRARKITILIIMNPVLCMPSTLTNSFRLQCSTIDVKLYINLNMAVFSFLLAYCSNSQNHSIKFCFVYM